MNDKPVKELFEMAKQILAKGGIVFYKWTCKGCGARNTFSEPNKCYEWGLCEDCGESTNVLKQGGGLLAVLPGPGDK